MGMAMFTFCEKVAADCDLVCLRGRVAMNGADGSAAVGEIGGAGLVSSRIGQGLKSDMSTSGILTPVI
jgi:hypothetical protein